MGIQNLRAIGIASSKHTVCSKLKGRSNEKLCALLGLYVMEIMALVSFSLHHNKVCSRHLVSQLSIQFPYCGLSYHGLITQNDGHKIIRIVIGGVEDEDDHINCLSDVKLG